MTLLFRLLNGVRSSEFWLRLKQKWIRALSRLHDRTAVLRDIHRIKRRQ